VYLIRKENPGVVPMNIRNDPERKDKVARTKAEI